MRHNIQKPIKVSISLLVLNAIFGTCMNFYGKRQQFGLFCEDCFHEQIFIPVCAFKLIGRGIKMNSLLIISCSQRKIQTDKALPAIERYDGPTYRCLRKFREAQTDKAFPNNLRILIISAKYGLIMPETEVRNYDMKMTAARAKKWHLTYKTRFVAVPLFL